MEPTLDDGDLLCMVKPDPETIQPGDIITFEVPELDYEVCHRVVAVVRTSEGPSFITQGDGNFNTDEWIVYPKYIEGKVLAKVTFLMPVISFVRSLPGVITIELVFVLLFALLIVRRIRLQSQRRRERMSRSTHT